MTGLQWAECPLHFGFTARTSRESMTQRSTYFLRRPDADGHRYGECNYFAGLAPESRHDFETQLRDYCAGRLAVADVGSSALRCGIDMLERTPAPTAWSRGEEGIAINGLIWIDSRERMLQAIETKLDRGFGVLKLKIGSLTFDDELEIIRSLRRRFGPDTLELRLDANGSFTPDCAMQRLDALAPYAVHSIEQPLAAGLTEATAELCACTPVPIALDEELIGMRGSAEMRSLLETVRPQYIILKPTLCGGLDAADGWIETAESLGIGWWATSALESNVGLMQLAHWVSAYRPTMPQGLGTGQIYTDNVPSSLRLDGPRLWTDTPMGVDGDFMNRLTWH